MILKYRVHFANTVGEEFFFFLTRSRIVTNRKDLVMEIVNEFYVGLERILRFYLPAFPFSLDFYLKIKRRKRGIFVLFRSSFRFANFDNGKPLIMEFGLRLLKRRSRNGELDALAVFRTYRDEICHVLKNSVGLFGSPVFKRFRHQVFKLFRIGFRKIANHSKNFDEFFRSNVSAFDGKGFVKFVAHALYAIE